MSKMKMKFFLVLAAITVLLLITDKVLLANNFTPDPKGGSIHGKVADAATNKPMEYVNIAVYSATDSSLVTGSITSENGEFKIEKLPHGEYYVRISFLGFERKQTESIKISPEKPNFEIGIIELTALSSNLGEVSVTAEKSKVEYQIDKRVINVDQSVVAKGGSAVNVLENTPSVQVDPQGNLTLRGSSDYIVLIDGKPSVLKGSDALKQINAATIKQIEVITNPSAKYDADGQAGIINIIRKKDYMQGLNGTISTSIGNTDKYTANALINYRKGKVNVFAGIDFADNINRGYLSIHNTSYLSAGNQHVEESANQYYCNENLTGKLGIDYDLNEKNTFTLSGSYGKQGYDQGTDAQYSFLYEASDTKVFSRSSNFMDVTGNVPNLTFDYQHKFRDNHTLSFSSTYSAWDGRDENTLAEEFTNEAFQVIDLQSKLNYVKDNSNFQYRFNADYKQPAGKGTLEAGIQYRHEDRMDDLRFFNLNVEDNQWIPNQNFTYRLDYLNDIYSGYATYSGTKWGVGYMLGLRSEFFTRQITFSNDSIDYNFDKFMLYPSIHLSKDINGKHQFQLSYSRRINRPQPWILNKQPGYVDPYNIFQGSPYLEPEYTDAFELNYRLMYKILTTSIQTYFRNTSNSFNTLRLLQDNGIMVHQLINTNQQQSYGIEGSIDLNLTKWWQLSTGGNLYHYTIESLVENKQNSRNANSWDARLISNFTLKWGSRIQGVLYFQGAGIDAQGSSSGFYTVNLAVNQPILKGKANIGLSAQNLFDSIKFDYTVSNEKYDNSYKIRAEGPVLMFTASYSFNNFQNKQRGRSDDASFKGGGMF
jgi:outer membrane receptor protein involved in Fe transport